ncbi:MAG: UDP-N-acetylmuramoyl-L-alanine--D-glutamate ligase [Candidatus Woesebacteria bacterium]|jgi:UDP-N-acetylmuramoylalanine--D-glutamate ligase
MRTSKKILKKLANKSILILGFGREGQSTYQFLRKHFPKKTLTIADQRSLNKIDQKVKQIIKKDQFLKLNLGQNYLQNIEKFDLIFKTPGIPGHLKELQTAKKNKALISSNTQLFFEIIKAANQEKLASRPALKAKQKKFPALIEAKNIITIGITGTKGKSTTSSLVHHLLKVAGLDAVLLGNIGSPPLSKLDQIKSKSIVIIELSSHQLADLNISPQIAIIQNISSEHLDYYNSTEEYVAAKSSITKYQKDRKYKVICNDSFPKTKKIAKLSQGQHFKFALKAKNDSIVYIKDNFVIVNKKILKIVQTKQSIPSQTPAPCKEEVKIIAIKDIPLIGKHNLQNVMPAVLVARLFGISKQQIAQGIKSFKSLAHRLQLVAEIKGVKYYNDSLATMPDATISALQGFDSGKIILLAGGYERKQDFHDLAKEILKRKVKSLILFPTTGKRIWQAVKEQASTIQKKPGKSQKLQTLSLPKVNFVKDMRQAIKIAHSQAKTGDVVLLSPASASFGMFIDYRDRGEQFASQAKNLS